MKNHKLLKHGRQFKCFICDKAFTRLAHVQSHLKSIHSNLQPINSSEHQTEKKKRKFKKINCDVCKQVLTSKVRLKTHKLLKHSRLFECYICGQAFARLPNLQAHLKFVHSELREAGTPKCRCILCGRNFLTKKLLDEHKNRIHFAPDTIIKCDLCDNYVAKSLQTLRYHINSKHTNLNKFICNFCGQPFHNIFYLKEHMNTHLGLTPYKCDLCDKSFSRKVTRKVHLRVHTGEKPYKCGVEDCDRAYSHHTDMKRHRYSAHGILTKKHTCPICSKVYSENKLLKKHLESHEVLTPNI